VVEKLLELFVGKVDTKLLESVEIENFETGNIETTDKEGSGFHGGKGFVNVHGNPLEQFFKDSFGQSTPSVKDLLWGLSFSDKLGTSFDSWLT
jgi:hypothetical protein